jgi:hypothetical protein
MLGRSSQVTLQAKYSHYRHFHLLFAISDVSPIAAGLVATYHQSYGII